MPRLTAVPVAVLTFVVLASIAAAAASPGAGRASLAPEPRACMPAPDEHEHIAPGGTVRATQTNWAGISNYYLYACNASVRVEVLHWGAADTPGTKGGPAVPPQPH